MTSSVTARPPRQPRSDGERTRAAILRAAASLATVHGLEGLSIGTLATAIGMSKSGLFAHFGSKEELQLATVAEAEKVLREEVIQPALAAPPGVSQLAAACDAFLSYVGRRVFPGGCFFAATSLEWGARPGHIKDRLAAVQSDFTALLQSFAVVAVERHELPADEDPARLAFELHALLLGADLKFVLNDDASALDFAYEAALRRLGLPLAARSQHSAFDREGVGQTSA